MQLVLLYVNAKGRVKMSKREREREGWGYISSGMPGRDYSTYCIGMNTMPIRNTSEVFSHVQPVYYNKLLHLWRI